MSAPLVPLGSSNNTPPGFNYAKSLGIHSVAAAVIFAVAYIPLAIWFLRQSFKKPTYVHYVLTFFCCIRIAAFIIRAVLAGIPSAGQTLSLLIADEVLIGVGYFGLLYSAYTLVLDLDSLSSRGPSQNPILLLIRNRKIFRVILTVAVILGIVSLSSNNGQGSTAQTLHKISVIIFLVLTILQAVQTAWLAFGQYNDESYQNRTSVPFGRQHANLILLLISLLLMERQLFSTITISDSAKQNTEHFWYPLIVLPEIIAVALYANPGLVPSKDELKAGASRGAYHAGNFQAMPLDQVPLGVHTQQPAYAYAA